MMSQEQEMVFAIHPFQAIRDDEIDFDYGEPIIVIEKDDMYGDGWWKVSKKKFFFFFNL
jgi:hypothetical protein